MPNSIGSHITLPYLRLSSLCSTIYRYPTFYGFDHVEDGVPVVRGEHLRAGRIDITASPPTRVHPTIAEAFPKTILVAGDLVVSVRGSIGVWAQVTDKNAGWQISPNLIRISPNKEKVDPAFFAYSFSNGIRAVVQRAVQTQALPALGASDLKSMEISVPPLPLQRKIGEILRTWDDAIEKLEALRAANKHRRAWMRNHLFSGRARFSGYTTQWREVALSHVLTEHRLRGTGAEEVFSVSVHKGLVNQIEHLGRSFAAAETSHYNRVLPGDIVYTKSPTGDFPLGIIKQSKIAQEVIVSPLYGVFSPATRALGVILDALFESPIAVRNYLHPLVQKGAKNTIAITNRRFLEGKLRLPMDPAEQAAIAEVVEASQEELAAIEAEIEALTRQKRGLMQKLLTGEWRVRT